MVDVPDDAGLEIEEDPELLELSEVNNEVPALAIDVCALEL